MIILDRRSEIEEKLGIDFIDEFLLAENQNMYFYLDLTQEVDILQSPIFHVYSRARSVVSEFTNFHEMLLSINQKSELCELVGYEALIAELKKKLHASSLVELDMPLLVNQVPIWVSIRMRHLTNKKICIGRIRVKEEDQSERLYEASYKDSLTGLFNRNTLMLHLENISDNHSIYGVMIDIDHFKTINDTYGHEMGDAILKQFGQLLISIADERAIFYRMSGDEFFIQLKCNDNASLTLFLKQFQEAIRTIQIEGKSITVSMGIAKVDRQYSSNEILRFADLAMYIAKAKGRNTYHILPVHELNQFAM